MRSFTALCALLLAALPALAHPQQQSAPGASAPAASTAPAQTPAISPEKLAAIHHLMEIAKVREQTAVLIPTMITYVRKSLSSLNPGDPNCAKLADLSAERMQQKMEASLPALFDQMMPIYDKYYTTQDIEGLIAFYQTPLGQKMLLAAPQVVRDSQAIGFRWGEKIGRDSVQEILDEHPELKEAMGHSHGTP